MTNMYKLDYTLLYKICATFRRINLTTRRIHKTIIWTWGATQFCPYHRQGSMFTHLWGKSIYETDKQNLKIPWPQLVTLLLQMVCVTVLLKSCERHPRGWVSFWRVVWRLAMMVEWTGVCFVAWKFHKWSPPFFQWTTATSSRISITARS